MKCLKINDNTLCQIWGFFLFSASWLLFLCIIFVNSTSEPYRKLVFYFGIVGGGLFVLCIIASFSGPIKRVCCFDRNDNRRQPTLLRNALSYEANAILHIVSGSEKITRSVVPIVEASYIQDSELSQESTSVLTETPTLAIRLEEATLPYQLNQV